jgi:peptide/nickel transport system ATP-binding protein
MGGTNRPLLSVRGLKTQFDTDRGTVYAVDGVDFEIGRGETVCLVGESGSGKTVTSESITRLIPEPPGRIAAGEITFDGQSLTEMKEKKLRKLRGNRISHIFQNPQDALNPVYTVGWQIDEVIQAHEDVSDAEARRRTIDMLDRVGIPEPAARVDDYPHEFSGGMRQRVMIAMALVTKPDLLIADEPTTALDVTIQAQILRLLRDLQEEYDMSILLVTHDLGVVAEMADRVVVMYAGKVMETGDVFDIFSNPAHPYTLALLRCLPGATERLEPIRGQIPSVTDPPDGCRFHDRCDYAEPTCREGDQPQFSTIADDHSVSCIHYEANATGGPIDRDWEPTYDSTQADGNPSARSDGGDRR